MKMVRNDSTEAKMGLNQNIALSEKKKSSFLGGECLLTAGKSYSDLGENELAINYLTRALLLFKRYDGIEWEIATAKTQVVFGTVYHHQGDFASALGLYLPAEEIFAINGDYPALRNVISKIGDCYLQMNQFDSAGIYARKNLKIAEKLTTPFEIASVYIDYGNWLNKINKYDEGLTYYEKASELLEKADDTNLYHKWYYNYAFLLSRKEKYSEALLYYEKAYEAALKSGMLFDQIDSRYKMGLMNYYLKNFKTSSAILNEALANAIAIKSSLLRRNILDALSYIESEKKSFFHAYDFLNRLLF